VGVHTTAVTASQSITTAAGQLSVHTVAMQLLQFPSGSIVALVLVLSFRTPFTAAALSFDVPSSENPFLGLLGLFSQLSFQVCLIRAGYCFPSISFFLSFFVCFFVSKITRKRLDRFA